MELINSSVNIGDIVSTTIFILLIILFFVSFTVFIRRLSVTQRKKAENNLKMEQKLDRIIELLEQDKTNK
ncbi:DUF4083 domain-containing protein [Sporosarcina luteola]|uniref:DUF4083 family protein n=1 Tax=Sporosarcina luteola TaxID=582850 RepID=UPI00203BBEAC|nr:DUF4083 family protein [Sporosarcina luteola]MCM3743230.1 DUF4083 domain-containing protein [Sporosarcina luteola]